jgi:hypothetical protein
MLLWSFCSSSQKLTFCYFSSIVQLDVPEMGFCIAAVKLLIECASACGNQICTATATSAAESAALNNVRSLHHHHHHHHPLLLLKY